MNWKRWTVCLVRNHRWNKIAYGDHDDSGYFVRCRVCGHENHEGTSINPTII